MDSECRDEASVGATAGSMVESEIGDYHCLGCVCKSIETLLEVFPPDDGIRRAVMADVAGLYAERGGSIASTDFRRSAYGFIANHFPHVLPFWAYKRAMNDRALEAYSLLKPRRMSSMNAFTYGLRTALAGAGIDFRQSTVADILLEVDSLVTAELAIDHGELLQRRLGRSKQVLYLANNAGEIVFDRFFIKSMGGVDVSYVVNCAYAGYAASGQDADYVDMRGVAKVLANGCSAPSTIPERLSARAMEAFERADVIVAKGAANLESFYALHDERFFVLMRVPCAVVGAALGCAEGRYVVVNPEERLRELANLGTERGNCKA